MSKVLSGMRRFASPFGDLVPTVDRHFQPALSPCAIWEGRAAMSAGRAGKRNHFQQMLGAIAHRVSAGALRPNFVKRNREISRPATELAKNIS